MKKIILLTGATDGIGLATAEKLVAAGHKLLIHGRNQEKLTVVSQKLQALNKGSVETYRADLSDLNQVQQLAESIATKHQHLDVIINNAGVYKTSQPMNKNGLDVRFVVNTLAPYLLTQKLLPLMNSQGRVVNLSSAAQAPVDLQDLAGEKPMADEFNAYAQSKLAITMWSRYLAQSIGDGGPAIIAVNPGSLLASKMVKEGFGVAGKDINIGADILVSAAQDKRFASASGEYFDNDLDEFAKPHADALHMEKCQALVQALDSQLRSLGV